MFIYASQTTESMFPKGKRKKFEQIILFRTLIEWLEVGIKYVVDKAKNKRQRKVV